MAERSVADAKPSGPVTVQWVFVVGVDDSGNISLFDHEFVTDIKAKRVATLDDIYAASYLLTREKNFAFWRPSSDAYSLAFLVFQMPEGHIAASPNIFENLVPLSSPSNAQMIGACGVLQGQIIAQRAADLAAPLAVQATLSAVAATRKQNAPDAERKTQGGLILA